MVRPPPRFALRMARRTVLGLGVVAALLAAALPAAAQWSGLLTLEAGAVVPPPAFVVPQPDQLPHSKAASGRHDIRLAWLAAPTDRYPHGVLGDRIEAAALIVQARSGGQVRLDLPANRVFEDLMPRLADLDGDGRDEILVVESDLQQGASLAVYGLQGNFLELKSRSPFLGAANRWLNPLGVADFDGDGRLDIAVVTTPHTGGTLTLYRYFPGTLQPMASLSNVSTHRLGSTELGLGTIIPAAPGQAARLLVPDDSRQTLRLLEPRAGRILEVAQLRLPAAVDGDLTPDQPNSWVVRLSSGQAVRIRSGDPFARFR